MTKRTRKYHSIAKELAKNGISAFISGIELYNKPNLSYRNETVLIVISHAWEILLKWVLYKNKNRSVQKYIKESLNENEDENDNFISFSKVIDLYCLWKEHALLKEHLNMMRKLRNKVMHAYILPEELEAVVWWLFQKSYELLNEIIWKEFKWLETEMDFPFILPIWLKQPITKGSFLSSLWKREVPLIDELYKSTENLIQLWIEDNVIVPLTFWYDKKSKVQNADIVIAIDPLAENTMNFRKTVKLVHNAPTLQSPLDTNQLRKKFPHLATDIRKDYWLHKTKNAPYKAEIYKDISHEDNFQIYRWKDPGTMRKLISEEGLQEIIKRIGEIEDITNT